MSCNVIQLTGVIFDLDGTLVNSEPLNYRAWEDTLRGLPIKLDVGSVESLLNKPELLGASAVDIAQVIIEAYDLAPTYTASALAARKRQLAVKYVTSCRSSQLTRLWFPGVQNGIRQLEGQIGPNAMSLCTSNLRCVADKMLAVGAIAHVFADRLTCQEDIESNHMKPDPAPYARALLQLGHDPLGVAAIEDSVSGVRSAVAAAVGVILAVVNEDLQTNTGNRQPVMWQPGDRTCSQLVKALFAAGAQLVFSSTASAIQWCSAHAACRTKL